MKLLKTKEKCIKVVKKSVKKKGPSSSSPNLEKKILKEALENLPSDTSDKIFQNEAEEHKGPW